MYETSVQCVQQSVEGCANFHSTIIGEITQNARWPILPFIHVQKLGAPQKWTAMGIM